MRYLLAIFGVVFVMLWSSGCSTTSAEPMAVAAVAKVLNRSREPVLAAYEKAGLDKIAEIKTKFTGVASADDAFSKTSLDALDAKWEPVFQAWAALTKAVDEYKGSYEKGEPANVRHVEVAYCVFVAVTPPAYRAFIGLEALDICPDESPSTTVDAGAY
jgi:hypothetical protein